MASEDATFINFYKSYLTGEVKGTGKNRTLDCPFCDKTDHFSFDIMSGKGKCLVCEESFNHYSFMTKFHKAWLEHTDPSWYSELEETRGIPASTFEEAQFAYDSYRNRWLVPYVNPASENLLNLGYFITTGDKAYRIFKAPNIKGLVPLPFYMPFKFTDDNSELKILEGEWDGLAGRTIFPNENIIAAPGAGIFPEINLKLINGFTRYRLLYDNNEAGIKGVSKAANALSKMSSNIHRVNWDRYDKAKPGMDVRDLLVEKEALPARAILLHCMEDAFKLGGVSRSKADEPEDLSPGYVSSIQDVKPVQSISKYFSMYEKHMQLTENNRDAIKLVLAFATSMYLPGEPLWGFLVGVASGGKTTQIESYGGNNEYFDYASKITAKNFISGWNSGGDSSFLPRIQGKCFFIKDFTTVINMDAAAQKELFNILRDAYDGSIKIAFGNNVERNYHNTNFNMVAGVTYAIQKHNDAEMGERFLRIDYSGGDSEEDQDDTLLQVIQGFGSTNQKKNDLTEATLGYVKFIRENDWDITNIPKLDTDSAKLISSLARYTAYVRTKPDNDRNEGIKYRPKKEAPYRLGLQYTKVAHALVKVIDPINKTGMFNPRTNTISLNVEVKRLLTKLAHDTTDGFGQEIIKYLYLNPRSSRKRIIAALHIPATRCHRVINDLQFMKLVVRQEALNAFKAKPGPSEEVYVVGQNLREIMQYMYGDIK